MPTYHYSFIDSHNKKQKGKAYFPTKKHVFDKLISQGYTPHKITSSKWQWIPSYFLRSKLLHWFDNFHELIEGGMDLLEAINILEKDPAFKLLQELSCELKEQIKQGKGLSQSLETFPHIFSEEIRLILLSGEKSQGLSKSLFLVKNYLEKKEKLSQSLISALAYPCFLIAVLGVFSAVFLWYLVPSIVDNFPSSQIPPSLIFLNHLSLALKNSLAILSIGTFLICSSLVYAYIFSKSFKNRVIKLSAYIPYLGQALILRSLYIYFNCLSQLSHSGYTFDQSLTLLVKKNQHPLLDEDMQQLLKELKEGKTLTKSLKKTKKWPDYLLSYLRIAEQNNSFPATFSKLSILLEKDLKGCLKSMETVYHSLFIVLTGVMIAWIFTCFIAPLLNPSSFFSP